MHPVNRALVGQNAARRHLFDRNNHGFSLHDFSQNEAVRFWQLRNSVRVNMVWRVRSFDKILARSLRGALYYGS
jgi:hypothetical protein